MSQIRDRSDIRRGIQALQAKMPKPTQTISIDTGIKDLGSQPQPDVYIPVDTGDSSRPRLQPAVDAAYKPKTYAPPTVGYVHASTQREQAKAEARHQAQMRHESIGHVTVEECRKRERNFKLTGSYDGGSIEPVSDLFKL